uniref:G-protein coupled receptors family 1 profile domain-containing protein n=1 Tax=Anopheles farauti TaxID=69004 RepID=A0A182QYM4_9DIPT
MAAFVEPHFDAWTQGSGNMTVVDKVPPEMLHMVHPHWNQFPPMNPLWHSILGFAIFVLGMISMTGNGCVMYIFTNTKSLRTPSNLLVVNLAFSDFFMMFTMGPPMVINCWHETWVFGPFACEVYACLGSLFGCASIWTMTMIAFDRYNVIVKGLSAKPMSNNGALLRILGVPLATIWGSLFAKANAVYNPIVYGISHPKYRAALYQKFPSLSCQDAPADDGQSVASGATQASEEKA